MQIEVKGRNTPVTDELRELVEKRFRRIANQVSDLARLEVEVFHENNPSIKDKHVAEATLYLKGATLHVRDASHDLGHSVRMCEDELARQVKRHRDKRRDFRAARAPRPTPPIDAGGISPAV